MHIKPCHAQEQPLFFTSPAAVLQFHWHYFNTLPCKLLSGQYVNQLSSKGGKAILHLVLTDVRTTHI